MVEDLKITIEDGKVIAATLEYDGSRTVWAYSDETFLHLTGQGRTELHDCAEQLLQVAGEHDLLLAAFVSRGEDEKEAENEALRQEIRVLEGQGRRDARRIEHLERLANVKPNFAPTRPRPLRRPR